MEVRRAGQRHQPPELVLVLEREPFGQQDERLVPVHRGELAEDQRQSRDRLIGLLAETAGDFAGLRHEVALALRTLHRVVRVALADGHASQDELIATVGNGHRLGDTDVVCSRNRARMLADQPLHRQAEPQLVAGEIDARPRLGEHDEGDLIEGT